MHSDWSSVRIFEKRERLSPFRSHAALFANLFDIPPDMFYAAAVKRPSLLTKPDNLDKGDDDDDDDDDVFYPNILINVTFVIGGLDIQSCNTGAAFVAYAAYLVKGEFHHRGLGNSII